MQINVRKKEKSPAQPSGRLGAGRIIYLRVAKNVSPLA